MFMDSSVYVCTHIDMLVLINLVNKSGHMFQGMSQKASQNDSPNKKVTGTENEN